MACAELCGVVTFIERRYGMVGLSSFFGCNGPSNEVCENTGAVKPTHDRFNGRIAVTSMSRNRAVPERTPANKGPLRGLRSGFGFSAT